MASQEWPPLRVPPCVSRELSAWGSDGVVLQGPLHEAPELGNCQCDRPEDLGGSASPANLRLQNELEA
jgi:hypothetical protein